MRTLFLASTLLVANAASAQSRFVQADYTTYYDWFHQQSQTADLYKDGTTLYTFSEQTRVRQSPCKTANVLAQLPIGFPITNIEYGEYYLPKDEINGYGDIWYHVKGKTPNGQSFNGYIWGADIAKGWRKGAFTSGAPNDLLLLGISSKKRKHARDLNAELRIANNKGLVYQKTVPGLCIFEDCASSALLRVLPNQPVPGHLLIEASAFAIGCTAGVDKAYFSWNGRSMELVHQAEYTTEKQYLSKTFVIPTKKGTKANLCNFSHEDAQFNPVFKCKTIQLDPKKSKATASIDRPFSAN